MISLGEKISELRKLKGMTQEDLANTIGISAQSISKWENSTTMPDIMLLPVIANIFEVSIDSLFGKDSKVKNNHLSTNCIYEETCNSLLETLHRAMWSQDQNYQVSYEDALTDYKKSLKENQQEQTVVIRENGIVFYKQEIGGLILNKPENGWLDYFKDTTARELLSSMADDSFMKIFIYILENPSVFTTASLSKKCELFEEETEKHIIKMVDYGILAKKEVELGEEKINIYELSCINKVFELFAVMAYAKQFLTQNEWYRGFWGMGNFILNKN